MLILSYRVGNIFFVRFCIFWYEGYCTTYSSSLNFINANSECQLIGCNQRLTTNENCWLHLDPSTLTRIEYLIYTVHSKHGQYRLYLRYQLFSKIHLTSYIESITNVNNWVFAILLTILTIYGRYSLGGD